MLNNRFILTLNVYLLATLCLGSNTFYVRFFLLFFTSCYCCCCCWEKRYRKRSGDLTQINGNTTRTYVQCIYAHIICHVCMLYWMRHAQSIDTDSKWWKHRMKILAPKCDTYTKCLSVNSSVYASASIYTPIYYGIGGWW